MSTPTPDELRARAETWLAEDPDEATREELKRVLDAGDAADIADRFGAKLEFGTAGLRGVLGAGPNRMNRSVVIRTTAGLCAYLRKMLPDAGTRGIVIGYDGRRMSREFAEDTAAVCAGAGVRAILFADTVPTPLLAYAVEDFGAAAGVMVTASHNPPEYNGFKVYWGNGAQIIPPHDVGIAAAIEAVGPLHGVARPILKEARARGLVVDADGSVERNYLADVAALARHRDDLAMTIVYTPMHGVGWRMAKRTLAQAGFNDVHVVPAQAEPDGAFPTVKFPNPEEPGALELSMKLADATRADLILANDPDADRLAVAVRGDDGRWVQLTGNEVGILFAGYLLVDDPAPKSDRAALTTVVSTPLLGVICEALGVRYESVLTGFKWIANRAIVLEAETGTSFVFGFEEALGYSVGDVVRDKDGVSAAAIFAELVRYYRVHHGRNVLAQLEVIYRRFGFFTSTQHNVTVKGFEGTTVIAGIMDGFRRAPPADVGGTALATITDIRTGERRDLATGNVTKLTLPSSNVIAYVLADGSRITLRPSGTEPKIKYYFDVRETVRPDETMADARVRARQRQDTLVKAFVAIAAAHQAQTA